ncbi:unnamed protein product [Arabis nemorensis]|uniref:Reverse transcriptase zinc-binding domain-containing protein n=1 Tax=Arabis nemorensis TaxID=586526 RepID=A0A565BWJ9_9BRAS|nr:unnamed protein product [Arabis nemorensis]
MCDNKTPVQKSNSSCGRLPTSLPVGERLLSRHIPVDPKCKRFGEVETIPHLFFQCAFSQQVWRTTPFVGGLENVDWTEYEQAWTILKNKICLPPGNITTGPLAPWILWSLWICRNKLVLSARESHRRKPSQQQSHRQGNGSRHNNNQRIQNEETLESITNQHMMYWCVNPMLRRAQKTKQLGLDGWSNYMEPAT